MERILYLRDDFCAVAEDGRLVEYIPAGSDGEAGRILEGRVDRIMSGLDAAFVRIGRLRDGFLPLKENSRTFTGGKLRSGDRVLVQIRKEETGVKGAYLSRDLSIPGSFLILMPMNRHIGVSARIQDPEIRERLTSLGQELSKGVFGLVLREAAASASEKALTEELRNLREKWSRIQAGDFSEESAAEELIRDYAPRGIDRTERESPLPADLVRQLKEAENRRIVLPHGGNIVIDRCEALTVIDVNSASDAGEGSRRETVLRANMEACREIMIQTRLRNLSGILILDLIDMDLPEDQDRVRQYLEEVFRADRMKTVIHGYTSLGLMEMTRKRGRSPWTANGGEKPGG